MYCHPQFGPKSGSGKGYNEILNNSGDGIYAYYYSDPFLGSSDNYGRIGGYNSIYDNDYNAYADYVAHIEAEYNYWEGQFNLNYGPGTVDYQPYLTFEPDAGSSLGKSVFITGNGGKGDEYGDFNPMDPNPDRLSDLWLWANELFLTDQHDEAINIYKILVKKFPDTPEAQKALVKVYHLHEDTELNRLIGYLNSLISNPEVDVQIKQIASDLLIGSYRRNEQPEKAIQICEKNFRQYPDTESEKLALFNLVIIYNIDFNEQSLAQNYLEVLKRKYPNDYLTISACEEMGEEVDWSIFAQKKRKPIDEKSVALPDKFALRNNYPNPFNPSTTIAFDLPEATRVRLKIYDISGREIVTLVNGHCTSGYKRVIWNGKNAAGNPVATGVYLYHFHTSTGFSATSKMVLVR